METKIVETHGTDSESVPLYSIRWGAIFASLVVGIGVEILLMMVGVAAGFAVYGSGARPDGGTLPVAALAWNGGAMIIAAIVGGYVAGRASGLRRTVDGMLHGLVSWGAALLCFIVVTGSLTGSVVTGVFGMAGTGMEVARASDSAVSELLAGLERGDREATMRSLRDGFGLTQEQAASAADRAMAMSGRGGEGTPSSPNAASTATTPSSADLTQAAKVASTASAWLSLMVLLSLIAGAGGGLIGARGARQRALPGRHADRLYRHRTDVRSVPDAG